MRHARPTEAIRNRPVNGECPADHIAGWEIAPVSGVQTVHCIVTHDHQVIRSDRVGSGFIGKNLRLIIARGGLKNFQIFLVHMAGELAVARRLLGVERINVFKVRRTGIQVFAVNDQMPVVADLDFIAGQRHEALDVKLILRQAVNALGFKYDDLAA